MILPLNEDRVFLLGHSHGGFVVQKYAITHPERVAGLVAYTSAARKGPEFAARADQNARRQAERHSCRPEMADALAAWAAPDRYDDASASAHFRRILPLYFKNFWAGPDQARRLQEQIVMSYVAQLIEPFDFRDELHTVSAPGLAIIGTYDWISDPIWSAEIASHLPQARLAVLPGSGHMAHIEEPELFASAVSDLLAAR